MRTCRFLALLSLWACAPTPSATLGPIPSCISEGHAADFLRSITGEFLRDANWTRDVGWKAVPSDIVLITEGPMCKRASKALAQAVTPTRLDSVAVVRAGNRYTAIRTGQLDVILVLDDNGHDLRATVLE